MWNKLHHRLILASQSPRRRELLTTMGFDFTVQQPVVGREDAYFTGTPVVQAVAKLARDKALSVGVTHRDALVLGGDTVVVIDDCAIGKPDGAAEAAAMLRRLSGRRHAVVSGVALVRMADDFTAATVARTEVFFRDIGAAEIDDYIALGEYADKAGAYAIQGKAMTFVEKIDGCFYNVVGLPIAATIGLFRAFTHRKESNNG
jgi:septum formation protein